VPIAAAFSLHDLVPLAQVAGCVLGAEFVVSEYIKQQVAQGVRLRCGEPRSVDWTAERELQEFTDQLMETRVPHSEMVVRRCEAAEKGFGLFTTVPITSGAFIAEYTGRVYKGDDHGSVPLDGAYAISTCSARGDPFYVDGSDPGAGIARFMNHAPVGSSANNVACVRGAYKRASPREPPTLLVFARRSIAAGEELSFDYGSSYWAKRGGDPTEANDDGRDESRRPNKRAPEQGQ